MWSTEGFQGNEDILHGAIVTDTFHVSMCVSLLSRFSRLQLFETLENVARQALLSWDSPGESTGVGGHSFLQGSFPHQ